MQANIGLIVRPSRWKEDSHFFFMVQLVACKELAIYLQMMNLSDTV